MTVSSKSSQSAHFSPSKKRPFSHLLHLSIPESKQFSHLSTWQSVQTALYLSVWRSKHSFAGKVKDNIKAVTIARDTAEMEKEKYL
jgi:hypothetical protein